MGTWTLWQLHEHEVDEEVPGAFSSVQGLVLCKAGAIRVAGRLRPGPTALDLYQFLRSWWDKALHMATG